MQKKAVISVILAGILWGVISIFINKLSAAGFDPLQISLIRLILAAIVAMNRRSDPGLQSETVDRSERGDGYGEKRRED